ncbi:hypothetical protein SO694_00008410 [Aureococcus anophagefferens]|uniref:Uncharacterized protein n=1 Tax=Aureococcus anophagefferens TaxID=44056 RepID=A0ABR1GEA2_AURAN
MPLSVKAPPPLAQPWATLPRARARGRVRRWLRRCGRCRAFVDGSDVPSCPCRRGRRRHDAPLAWTRPAPGRVAVLRDFIPAALAARAIRAAEAHLVEAAAHTVGVGGRRRRTRRSAYRTNRSCFLDAHDEGVVRAIRAAVRAAFPEVEGRELELQVVHYKPGEVFRLHSDVGVRRNDGTFGRSWSMFVATLGGAALPGRTDHVRVARVLREAAVADVAAADEPPVAPRGLREAAVADVAAADEAARRAPRGAARGRRPAPLRCLSRAAARCPATSRSPGAAATSSSSACGRSRTSSAAPDRWLGARSLPGWRRDAVAAALRGAAADLGLAIRVDVAWRTRGPGVSPRGGREARVRTCINGGIDGLIDGIIISSKRATSGGCVLSPSAARAGPARPASLTAAVTAASPSAAPHAPRPRRRRVETMGEEKPGLLMNTAVGTVCGAVYGSVVSAWVAPKIGKLDGVELSQDALPSFRTMTRHVGGHALHKEKQHARHSVTRV